jgi:hypothetical protein
MYGVMNGWQECTKRTIPRRSCGAALLIFVSPPISHLRSQRSSGAAGGLAPITEGLRETISQPGIPKKWSDVKEAVECREMVGKRRSELKARDRPNQVVARCCDAPKKRIGIQQVIDEEVPTRFSSNWM